MIRPQPTMAQVHAAFKEYVASMGYPIKIEWPKFKLLLLTRMTEDAKRHG
jgi:hypothetical protein